MNMVDVDSSMISAVGYDAATHRMQVIFNSGRVYCYETVPLEEYEGLLNASSKGSYMLSHIIDMYPYSKRPCPKQKISK